MRFPRLICGLIAVLAVLAGRSQDALTEGLPDSLRQGAAVVCRQEVVEISIESPHRIRVHRKWINTILNNNGDVYGLISTFYDKFHDLSKITATLYDAEGKPVKKIRKSDLEDALIGGMGMLEVDTRVKYYQFVHRDYPYTIECEEEQVLNNGFVIPSQWFPQPSPLRSVLSSSLVVHAPGGYGLRYKEYDCRSRCTSKFPPGGRGLRVGIIECDRLPWNLGGSKAVVAEGSAEDSYGRQQTLW